ncbi:SURF1 family protein [Marmoricola sp. RAF53]|uniref:SURF1 family protein n=1 Tax=Marmoricola sp. RAF53 TaxID=3233059 RepID=UPI003F9E2B1C
MTLLRPRYWPGHLAMLVCVALATGLGLWQFDAWQTRRDDAARDVSKNPAVALATVMTGDSPFPGRDLGRPVTFKGTWIGGNAYVADRYVEGKRGYWVVTPVLVDGGDSAMLVVRGWSPKPDVPAPTGQAKVTGWLQATEGSGPFDEDPTDEVIPTMRIASLVEKVDSDLYSGYVVAKAYSGETVVEGDAAPPDLALKPVTPDAVPPVSGFTALRNLLYAIEWWVFAAFALFVWVRWCRDTLNPPEEPEPEPQT